MNATQCQHGKIYRVTALRKMEYLTIGEVYKASGSGMICLGLHRVTDGAGTYLRQYDASFVDVVEVTQ
jgi:hypothetical protein